MSDEQIKFTTLEQETSELLKNDVIPFCEYMKGEIPEGSKNGLLVIAVDAENEEGKDHTLMHACGDDEHIARALAVLMLSKHGAILRRASNLAMMMVLNEKMGKK